MNDGQRTTRNGQRAIARRPFRIAHCPLVVVLFVGAALSLPATSTAYAEDWRPKIDALVKPAVESVAVVGLAVGIVHNGQTHTFGYGKVSCSSGAAPDEKTLFEIGSITKVFTALALADMAREKLVRLDDPVRKWLPESVKVPSRDGKEITLADLATHTSGLPRLGTRLMLQAVRYPLNPYARFTVEDLYATLAESSLASTPGTKYGYSNLAAGLLGHVLARRAGMSYEELIRRRILIPLNMTDTRIALTEGWKSRLAEGHDIDGNPLPPWDFPTLAGAGGLRSDVRDLLRFVQANLAPGGTPRVFDGRGVGAAKDHALRRAAGRATQPLAEAILETQKPRLDFAPGQSICLGWHWRKADKTLWHNGQTGGYHSYVGLRKDSSIGVVVLGNTAGGTVDAIGLRLLDLLEGKPTKPLEFKKPVHVDPAVLERYVGNYEMLPNFILYVTRQGDRLWVQATNQPRLGIYPESETEFFYRAVDARIAFVANKEGKFDKLILHQHGLDMPAWKGGLIVHFGGQLLKGLGGQAAKRAAPKSNHSPCQ